MRQEEIVQQIDGQRILPDKSNQRAPLGFSLKIVFVADKERDNGKSGEVSQGHVAEKMVEGGGHFVSQQEEHDETEEQLRAK